MHQDQVRLGQILKQRDGGRYLVVHTERGGPHKIKSARTGSVFAEEQHRFDVFDVESEPLNINDVKVGQILIDFEGNKAEVLSAAAPHLKYQEVLLRTTGRNAGSFFNQHNLNEAGFRIYQHPPFVAPPPQPVPQPEPKATTVTISLEETLADSRLLITVKPEIINSVVSRELKALTFSGDTTFDDIAADAIERDLAVLLDIEGALKSHREDEDITQDTVARRCEVPVAFISMIENGALAKLVAYLTERK